MELEVPDVLQNLVIENKFQKFVEVSFIISKINEIFKNRTLIKLPNGKLGKK